MSKEMNEKKEIQEQNALEESALENVSGGGLVKLQTRRCNKCNKNFPRDLPVCPFCNPQGVSV